MPPSPRALFYAKPRPSMTLCVVCVRRLDAALRGRVWSGFFPGAAQASLCAEMERAVAELERALEIAGRST